MNFATRYQRPQILVWLLWVLACLVFLARPDPALGHEPEQPTRPALPGIVSQPGEAGELFPWQSRQRWRKWAWQRYCRWRRAYRRAVWLARLARLGLSGALSLAQVVDLLIRTQLRRQLGALPVLYHLLETLQVRQIINRYCPTQAAVDHGQVAVVLILNRLSAPRPLFRLADWLAQTVLVYQIGVPAAKFNDDRLARTLDALSQHPREIWQAIVAQALLRADLDVSMLFYDLTAFVVHGRYPASQHIDFGFAHNTPMDKRKFKVGLNVAADGHIPLAYQLWSGRTADAATVQANMDQLSRLFQQPGWPRREVMLIGDRANLNDELALAYEQHDLRYLAGLQPQTQAQRQLLTAIPERHFYRSPLTPQRGAAGYWGRPGQIRFDHAGRQVTHRCLVVLSGPLCTALRRSRASQFRELRQSLQQLRAKIGQPYYRTVSALQQRADTQLKRSPVGKFMRVEAFLTPTGQLELRWWLDRHTLWQAMQTDGRYLLVTNDCSLSPERMLSLYRQKDGVEKRFKVAKSELNVSPVYLHKDERIEAMLLINMLALLVYSLLERQARRNGLALTTRRIIDKLETLTIIETICWDGSRLTRLVPLDADQAALCQALAHLLAELRLPRWPHPGLSAGDLVPLTLPPPDLIHQLTA